MNLVELLKYITKTAEETQSVSSAFSGDVYALWNAKEVKYSSVVVSVRSIDREDNMRRYNLTLYYADRLLQDGSNKDTIFDDASNCLQVIINKLDEVGEVTNPYTIELFEQQFSDFLAGGYVNFSIEMVSDLGNCDFYDDETEARVLEITENGSYNVKVFDVVDVNVPGDTPKETKNVSYTENGSYTVEHSTGYLMKEVNVDVNVDQHTTYISELEQEVSALTEENISLVSEISNLESNISELENDISGLNEEISALESDLSGLNEQIDSITSLNISENGHYETSFVEGESPLGWNEVDVNVDQHTTYISELEAEVSALSAENASLVSEVSVLSAENEELLTKVSSITSLNISQNGHYETSYVSGESPLGWNSIDVSVAEAPPTEAKHVTYTNNGSYEVTPSTDHVLSLVSVDVNVDQHTTYISELEAEVSALSAENASLVSEISNLESNISELENDISGLNDEISALESDLSSLNEQIDSITSLNISENGHYETSFVEGESPLGWNEVDVNVDQHTTYISELEAEVSALSAENASLVSEVSSLESEVSVLSAENEELLTRVSSLTTLNISQNGTYQTSYVSGESPLGWNEIVVSVSGSGLPTESVNVTYISNGSYVINPSSGHVISEVNVNISVPTSTTKVYLTQAQYNNLTVVDPDTLYLITDINREDKQVIYTANGSYLVEKSDGYDVLNSVSIIVSVDQHTTYISELEAEISTLSAENASLVSEVSALSAENEELLAQVSSLTTLNISQNGTYSTSYTSNTPAGWNQINVSVNVTILEMTQAQYDNLTVIDPDTVYLISL